MTFLHNFPLSETSSYSKLLFDKFDYASLGRITFEQFISGFSTLARGTYEERLDWIYSLYDKQNLGYFTLEDFDEVARSLVDLMGIFKESELELNEQGIISYDTLPESRYLFGRMDINRDGMVTRDEFLDYAFMVGILSLSNRKCISGLVMK